MRSVYLFSHVLMNSDWVAKNILNWSLMTGSFTYKAERAENERVMFY